MASRTGPAEGRCESRCIPDVVSLRVNLIWFSTSSRQRPERKKALLVGIQYGDDLKEGSSRAIGDVKRFWELLVCKTLF